jgi:hypothetical protein
MEHQLSLDLETYFATVDDPRVERTKRHKLLDIIIIAICGMICGAEGWGEPLLWLMRTLCGGRRHSMW